MLLGEALQPEHQLVGKGHCTERSSFGAISSALSAWIKAEKEKN